MYKGCKGCIHRRRLGLNCQACLYSVDTGELRGCPPAECTHYSNDKAERKRIIAKLARESRAYCYVKKENYEDDYKDPY